MSRDQAYGGLIFALALVIAIVYVAAFVSPTLALPSWLQWWAIALPVFLFVLTVLVISMWIGWTMLTTPPPAPLETEMPSATSSEEKKPKRRSRKK